MQICSPITANCYVCKSLQLNIANMNVMAGLIPATTPYLWVTDKFGNQYRVQVTIKIDGSFDIDKTKFPEGFFMQGGSFDLFLSSDINGNNVLTIFSTFICIILSITC